VKRGDIVIAVMRGEIGKPRPAVVVQADELGGRTNSVVVCPMSSELFDPSRLRPMVDPSVHNGLRVRSQIMTDKVTAVARSRIRRVVGTLDKADRERLDGALLLVLGLAR
jgi:mRNA interferase MazF